MEKFHGGKTSYWPDKFQVTEDTLFDIASVTKAVATGSILARLVDRGAVRLDTKLGELRADFRGTRYAELSLKELATHTAGLKAWKPIYLQMRHNDLVRWFLDSEKGNFKKDSTEEYSDLSILLLWLGLEKKVGELQSAFQKEVLAPLKLSGISFGPVPSQRVAATEYCLWRKTLLQGEVFDENSYALGGVSAQAGLFSNARSLAPWCEAWLSALLGKSDWIKKETAETFVQKHSPSGTRAIVFDTKSKVGSTLGEGFSDLTFGHLGYTGCSVWMDPKQNGFAICLTNRIHPSRYNDQMKLFRTKLHTLIGELWRAA